MKSLLTLTTLMLASNAAMALDTTMDMKGRFDYVRTETETNNPGTTPAKAESSSGEYKLNFIRLGAAAKFNDTTKFRLVLDLTDSNTAVSNSVSEFVDEAVLTKSLIVRN